MGAEGTGLIHGKGAPTASFLKAVERSVRRAGKAEKARMAQQNAPQNDTFFEADVAKDRTSVAKRDVSTNNNAAQLRTGGSAANRDTSRNNNNETQPTDLTRSTMPQASMEPQASIESRRSTMPYAGTESHRSTVSHAGTEPHHVGEPHHGMETHHSTESFVFGDTHDGTESHAGRESYMKSFLKVNTAVKADATLEETIKDANNIGIT